MLHTILHLISDLLIFIINLGVVIYILMIITFDFRHFDMIENVWNNWNTNIVSELYLYQDDNDFKQGMIMPLFNYTFEGMRRGCDCAFGSIDNQEQSQLQWEGDCSIKQIISGCTQINEREREYFSKINDIGISIVRNNKLSYFNEYSSYIQSNCLDDNTKDCGVIDTINNRLCIPKYEECPSITIYDNTLIYRNNDDNSELIREAANVIKANPLSNISFKLSNDKICVNEDESPVASNISFPLLVLKETSEFYPDSNEKTNICCYTSLIDNQTIDSRYSPILSSQLSSIFSYELKAYLNQIPSFPFNSYINTDLNIYSIGYIGWNKNCSNYIPKIKPLTYIQYHLKSFFTFYLVTGLIILPYFFLFIMLIAQIDNSNLRLHLALFFSHYILILIFGTMIYNDYSGIYKIKDVIFEISRRLCSDNETNKLFYSLIKDIRAIEEVISFILLLIELMGFGSLIKIFLVIAKQNKRKIMSALLNSNIPLITRVEIEMVTI